MHDEVRIRETGVNFLHAVNRQNFARGFAGELISTVARADRDSEGIKLGLADEVNCLIRIGEQLLTGQRAFSALTVFFSLVSVSREPMQPSSPSTDTPMQ